MTTSKSLIALVLFIISLLLTNKVASQEYLDSDERYMKLGEVTSDKTYGFEYKNPIKVGADEKAVGAYLNSLESLDGDRMHIEDLKFDYKRKKGLTLVVLNFEQKRDKSKLYFLTTEFDQPKAIIGYTFKTINDLPKVITFPTEDIINVSNCSESIYSVDDFLLKEKIGKKKKPSKNPIFKGGINELKKYFAANPLKDEGAAQSLFKVRIAFVVNCEGKAGNFEIISKGRGELATYANQVLEIANGMPKDWEPAIAKGKEVDCYQVLSFTVLGGSLDKVNYR